MFAELKMVWEARSWMKKNEPFLPTWHAYVGYKLDLFQKLANKESITKIIEENSYNRDLIDCWIDVGIVIGHLKRKRKGIVPKKKMVKYFSKESPVCIGELLKELLEMHMPALMNYPELVQGQEKNTYYGNQFGETVAATSSLIEKRAFTKVYKELKSRNISSALDIGCGTGGYVIKLAKKMKQGSFIGIDLNKEVIDEAKANAKDIDSSKVDFTHSSLEEWDGKEAGIDAIMMNNLLHYYPPENRLNLLKRSSKLLSSNGMVLIVTPLYLEKSGKRFATAFNAFMNAHKNLYSLPRKKDLIKDAKKVGLTFHSMKTIVGEGSWYLVCFEKSTE